ncbi:hypothetical protein cypCar_00026202 [Cyprinus carpio]|nr:hypothetical protein cypCar_00026202 [Cyprinus carpio]
MATQGSMCNTSISDYANQSSEFSNISLQPNGSSMAEEDSTKILAVIYIVVFVVGLTGNSLAIFVVLRYTKMKTVTNMYILNLAVADELYILGLPFLTTHNVLAYWPFGNFLCRILMWADSISQFTSTFCLTVMSIDRYMAVVHPIRSTSQSCNTWQRLSWPEPRDCLVDPAFILYTAILGFFCPLLVICLCYLLIVIKVKSTSARAGLSKRSKSEKKVTRMVVIIVVVFVLCWLPFFILNILNLISTLPENSLITGIYFLTVILTYVNSCANPLLYSFLSDNFKRSFQQVLCIHRVNGVSNGHPGRERLSRNQQNEALFPPRSFDFKEHVQSYQSIGLKAEACDKSENHRPGPQPSSQSI